MGQLREVQRLNKEAGYVYKPLTLEILEKAINNLKQRTDEPRQMPSLIMGYDASVRHDFTLERIRKPASFRFYYEFVKVKRGRTKHYISLFEKHGLYKVLVRPTMTHRYRVFKGTEYLFDTDDFPSLISLQSNL